MYQGLAKYQCPNCGEHFTAAEIEIATNTKSVPAICPKCGTWTNDKYWNQTSLPDGLLVGSTVAVLFFVLAFVYIVKYRL